MKNEVCSTINEKKSSFFDFRFSPELNPFVDGNVFQKKAESRCRQFESTSEVLNRAQISIYKLESIFIFWLSQIHIFDNKLEKEKKRWGSEIFPGHKILFWLRYDLNNH